MNKVSIYLSKVNRNCLRISDETSLSSLLVYLDDIIIYSFSVSQHFKDLHRVWNNVHEGRLTINPKKSRFCQQEIQFLGHIVN